MLINEYYAEDSDKVDNYSSNCLKDYKMLSQSKTDFNLIS